MRIPHDRERGSVRRRLPVPRRLLGRARVGPCDRGALGRPAESCGDDAVWELEAHYLALGLVSVICVLSPERIVIGGGVMSHAGAPPLVQREVRALMNGYLDAPAIQDRIEDYVTLPTLAPRSGVLGAIALAASA